MAKTRTPRGPQPSPPKKTPEAGAATEDERLTAGPLKTEAQKMSRLALDTLAAIMSGDGQDSAKLAAAREVLDRAYGKPQAPAKPKARSGAKAAEPMTVIVKRFTDVTPQDEAEADATEAQF
jgi:hypothetical protein